MKSTRRQFLGQMGTAGAALTVSAVAQPVSAPSASSETSASPPARRTVFNMCGHGAPPLETVRIGVIGIGARGAGALQRLRQIGGARITALCDVRPERIAVGLQELKGATPSPATYSGRLEAWKELCARDDIDLVYICTPWALHAPMAVHAMEQGKHAAVEVPAATSVEECWQLVETSERTKRHCIMLENCCYDFFDLLTLNLARQGFFGELVHAEGAYLHDLLEKNFSTAPDDYYDLWRLKENLRNGNLYPTHGLGPIAQIMNINRGDRFDYLVSMQSDDFQMAQRAEELARADPAFRPFVGKKFRGNMNTTTVRTARGRTMLVQHDVTSHRPYSRIHAVVGTKAMAQKWPLPPRISKGHDWMSEAELQELERKFTYDFVRKIEARAREIGGHGGMDYIMDWRLVTLLRRGMPLDMDVYDAAAWTAVGLLSEKSVANRSASVDVPDFTGGHWQTNRPLDLTIAIDA